MFTAHVQKRLFTSFQSKILPRHSLRRPRFLYRQMYFHYRVTFTGYIRCFRATTSHDFVTLTFDRLTLSVSRSVLLMPDPHTNFYYPRLSVTELWITEFDHIFVNRHCHCACAVSRGLSSGQKWSTFLKSLTPYTYLLCHFQGATTKIKPCYMRKIAFISLSRLQSSLRMRSITWPVHMGSPKTTCNNFLILIYLFTIQVLWGYDDD